MDKISRYQIRSAVGSGGMGQVHLAFDPVIERQVALKTVDRTALPPAEAAETLARFKREAIAAGRLTHPNIVTVYEYGEEGPYCYIAMEHVEGQSLRDYLARVRTPPLEVVLAIARQVFSAMIYPHQQGVLHRDLKPSNILLAGQVDDPASVQAKILDFGIARISSAAALTHIGIALGTPGYMSPEQYLGEPIDGRTDMYSLGVMLFEMLTGEHTFKGNLAEVLEQVVNKTAPRLSAVRAGLPSALDEVIARALARQPADRHASMREFREAFVAALAPAQPPTYAMIFPPATADAASSAAEATVMRTLPMNPVPAPAASPAGAVARPQASQLAAVAQTLARGMQGAAAGAKPTVLFLDDEERILGALTALFRLQYNVVVSTDGAQALDLVRTHKPNVIVSDQRMPNMLGVDFLRQAREIDPTSVRILLTGYSDLAAIVGSINDGEVFRFVNKPWSNQEIRNTIAEAVGIAMSTRQVEAAKPAAPPVATEASRATEAILVVQSGTELFSLVNDGFGRTHPVCHAATVADALQTLEDQEVAVVLCDLDTVEGASVMLKLLKQSHPQILSVAVTGVSDSEALIALINQAQIFRFINKPIRLGLLDAGLRGALTMYAQIKAQPTLARRQTVETKPEVAQSSIGRQILQRIGMFLRPKAG